VNYVNKPTHITQRHTVVTRVGGSTGVQTLCEEGGKTYGGMEGPFAVDASYTCACREWVS